jgi:hypothetical protein
MKLRSTNPIAPTYGNVGNFSERPDAFIAAQGGNTKMIGLPRATPISDAGNKNFT